MHYIMMLTLMAVAVGVRNKASGICGMQRPNALAWGLRTMAMLGKRPTPKLPDAARPSNVKSVYACTSRTLSHGL